MGAVTLLACGLFGGSSRFEGWPSLVPELLSLVTLCIALPRLLARRLPQSVLFALALCTAIVALPALQLVALPPDLWTRLAGRDLVLASLEAAGGAPQWAPLSLAPNATLSSALALLPPFAIFAATLQFDRAQRWMIVIVLLALGGISSILGLAQVADGPDSSLRFYAITNPTEAVGFFANRNHFAALMYALLPFAAAWTIDGIAAPRDGRARSRDQREARMLRLLAGIVLLIALLAAQVIAGSRAGVILAMIALVAVFVGLTPVRVGQGASVRPYLLISLVFVVLLSTQFALFRILGRFAHDPLSDARLVFSRETIKAASSTMPFGTGLGTFASFYGVLQSKADIIGGIYANHAHNDFLELWLETGVFGPILVAIFILWFVARAFTIWRRPSTSSGKAQTELLAKAATLAIPLLLLHSAVDYPLRTEALSAVFAFACALLFAPPAPERRSVKNMIQI